MHTVFTIYLYDIHIDSTKIALYQYLHKLIWVLLETIKLSQTNMNLCLMIARISTKAFPYSRQDHHEDEVLLLGKYYTLFSYSPMMQPFCFLLCSSILAGPQVKNQTCPFTQFSFLSILSNWEDKKKIKEKNEAYFDKSPWKGHDTCLIVRHWNAVKSFSRQLSCLPLTDFCSLCQAEHKVKLHEYDPTDVEFVRLRHKKHIVLKWCLTKYIGSWEIKCSQNNTF